MKKLVFPFLGILMLGLSGCMDKSGENIECFQDMLIPTIVEFGFTGKPEIITPLGRFVAPELQNALFTEIDDGDALLTYFCINYDQQISTDYTMASNLQWVKIKKISPYATYGGESLADDFITPIEELAVYSVIQYNNYQIVMFLTFAHRAASDQEFDYQMTYDPNNNSNRLYIRAKKRNQSTKTDTNIVFLCAFDMTSYLMTLRGSEKEISFNLYYKTGEEDGDDVYKEWSENPVRISFE